MIIDTNIIIELLKAQPTSETILEKISVSQKPMISVMTLYELHKGPFSKSQQYIFEKLLYSIKIIPISNTIAHCAGNIQKQLENEGKKIECEDCFIAATALCQDEPLITNNKKHFELINDLQVI